MNYNSRITTQSTVFPEVTYTLNKMSDGRRANLRLATAAMYGSMREQIAEARPLEDKCSVHVLDSEAKPVFNEDATPKTRLDFTLLTPEEVTRLSELHAAVGDIIQGKIEPAWIKWGLHSLSGLTIDDQPATPESLIESGPPELTAEIYLAIRKVSGLDETAAKNSQSPSTSTAAGAGAASGMTAANAENQDKNSSGDEIAASSTLN